MSTKPSLALIPSAYKASKVYSVLPNDGTGDFDFSRATLATRINKDGLIETVGSNVPRLNYPMIDGVVSGCPSLLLEPARTNLITYSEAFDNAAWIKVPNTSISDNFAISPDGTQNSSEIKATSTSTSVLGFYTGFTVSSGVEYTVSFFVKKGIVKYIQLYHAFSQVTGVPRTNFDLENGVVSVSDAGHTSSIEDYGNGWYRCIVKLTTATTILQTFFNAVKSPTAPRDASSSWSANDNFYFYGAQLEAGSYPTSYIPTSGSTTTRNEETCNGAGDANTFNDSEGVLMAEIKSIANTGVSRAVYLYDESNINDRVGIVLRGNGFITSQWSKDGETSILVDSSVLNYKSLNKVCLKYSSTNFSFFVNGFEVYSINGNYSFSNNSLDNLSFSLNGVEPIYCLTKQIQYFDTALNNTELEYITSYRSFNEMARELLYTIE